MDYVFEAMGDALYSIAEETVNEKNREGLFELALKFYTYAENSKGVSVCRNRLGAGKDYKVFEDEEVEQFERMANEFRNFFPSDGANKKKIQSLFEDFVRRKMLREGGKMSKFLQKGQS